jgi:anti-anti-sigma regulatory factor
LHRSIAQASRDVIVDLDAVSFIDATGIGAFVDARRRAREHGRGLALRGGPSLLPRLLAVLGLTDLQVAGPAATPAVASDLGAAMRVIARAQRVSRGDARRLLEGYAARFGQPIDEIASAVAHGTLVPALLQEPQRAARPLAGPGQTSSAIRRRVEREYAVVRVADHLDRPRAEQLIRDLGSLSNVEVIIDLRGCAGCTEDGYGALVELQAGLEHHGSTLQVRAPSDDLATALPAEAWDRFGARVEAGGPAPAHGSAPAPA